ncbi:MAG: hypothetical protein MUF57_10985 [Gammaproteobacteria bacterium]|nr:hypothetical protein [Gammaproteobacteria bacterium]
MTSATSDEDQAYLSAFRGSFTAALRWHQLDALWETVRSRAGDDWYVYAVGHTPPAQPAAREKLLAFVTEIDALLRAEHPEDYCGIVYSDEPADPSFIKIYDPHHLGAVCGSSAHPPLPGWVLSRLKPCDLPMATAPTKSRQRWWQRLFAHE